MPASNRMQSVQTTAVRPKQGRILQRLFQDVSKCSFQALEGVWNGMG